ncbi:hypothetical protein MPH_13253 [Macrophomina phaseolina MS6]|uniref:Uncharacterized protein n=1 Tax=Macrophomina phaseolina (strain MS6) TaxID=1126212 RepID=K2QIN1_MACPH|nr:hypothetical protein MPH_13253 [Macrophomina phaseolina MS6]
MMDTIEASECLRAWYGLPPAKTFDDETVGVIEGELQVREDKEHEDDEDIDGSDEEDELQIRQEVARDDGNAGAGAADEDPAPIQSNKITVSR